MHACVTVDQRKVKVEIMKRKEAASSGRMPQETFSLLMVSSDVSSVTCDSYSGGRTMVLLFFRDAHYWEVHVRIFMELKPHGVQKPLNN